MKLDFGGNKLLYHLDRLVAWKRGDVVTPIIYEISLTDACNSRCRMCTYEAQGRRGRFLSQDVLDRLPAQLAEADTKSYFLAGEGEPLLHPGAAEFCARCAALGVEGSLSTNGIAFNEDAADTLLATLTWIRFTILSFSSAHYMKLTSGGVDHSKTIRKNIEEACRKRAARKLDVAIGVQQLLLDDNVDDVVSQCRMARELGADYFVLMPGLAFPGGVKTQVQYSGGKEKYLDLQRECMTLATNSFQVPSEDRLTQRGKEYNRCLGFGFVSRIYADAKIYPCLRYRDDPDMALGDLSTESVKDIWHGERARRMLHGLCLEANFQNCQLVCRMNMTNKFLFRLSTPPPHVNFI